MRGRLVFKIISSTSIDVPLWELTGGKNGIALGKPMRQKRKMSGADFAVGTRSSTGCFVSLFL